MLEILQDNSNVGNIDDKWMLMINPGVSWPLRETWLAYMGEPLIIVTANSIIDIFCINYKGLFE